jgi:hypothetical protein
MKRKLLFVIMLSAAWVACKKADIRFGDQFLDDGYTQIVKVDSFSVDMSTIQVDSFVSSAKGTTLVGDYTDPVFGHITTQTYFEVIPPPYVDSFANTLFDSLVLVLKTNGGYYGDSMQPVTIQVHQLSEAIVPYDATGNIYSSRTFAVEPVPLGTKTLLVRPGAGDSIQVRLSDVLGNALLAKLQNNADQDMQNSTAFLQYLYGLRISGTGNNQFVFGCADSVVMRLCYRKPGLYMQSKHADFTLASNTHHFTHVQADRSGTVLKDLAALGQVNSSLTGHMAYSSYAAGAMVKIRFPSVRDILKLPNYAKIIKATLVIKPASGSYQGVYSLPPQLRLSQTTQLNQVGTDVTQINSDGTAVSQTGNLVIDDLYGSNTAYTYDVTSYLRGLVTDATINNNGLLLIPPSPALETQFNRLIVGDGSNGEAKTQLFIWYASVQ